MGVGGARLLFSCGESERGQNNYSIVVGVGGDRLFHYDSDAKRSATIPLNVCSWCVGGRLFHFDGAGREDTIPRLWEWVEAKLFHGDGSGGCQTIPG